MIIRHALFGTLTAAFVALSFGPSGASATDFANVKAIAFVKKAGADAINVLSANDLVAQQRKSRFRELILENFDTPAIARFVLGRHWQSASNDQKTRFVEAFKGALVRTYMMKFFDYSGESLTVSDATADPDGSIVVHSEVKNPTGTETYDLNWHIVDAKNALKLIDISINGVSTTLTQKQDYASVLQSTGGNVDDLIAKLKAQPQD